MHPPAIPLESAAPAAREPASAAQRPAGGRAPQVERLPCDAPPLVAIGADLQGAVCVAGGRTALLGAPVGDLADRRAQRRLVEDLARLEERSGIAPTRVAHDLHPGYHGTALARRIAARRGLPLVAVQHHHAHVASCLVEHGRPGPVIGVAWDGAGFGPDGTVWGGEFLVADLAGFRRAARIRPVAQPGGDAAAREPWRMALAHLRAAGVDGAAVPFCAVPPAARRLVTRMIERGVNAPPTSSAGRLFDAVAALAGLRVYATHPAQAAVELEARATRGVPPYPLPVVDAGELLEIDPRPLVREVVSDRARGVAAGEIGGRFHAALASAIGTTCAAVRGRTQLNTVVLTGGCFLNRILAESAAADLAVRGFEVLLHGRIPPGDGGLALGQAAVAAGRAHDVPRDPR